MVKIRDLNYAPRIQIPADWQKALTEQLRVLDEICATHGIKYSIAFGGLLGAVRHRGFIPWDNDVDVVMDEENYVKFRQLAIDGLMPEGYAFIDRETERDYTLLFGRFIDTRTSCPLSTSAFNGGRHGLFVDVFVLFPLPDDRALQEEAVTAFLVWEQLVCRYKRRSKYRTDLFYQRWRQIKAYERTNGRDAAVQQAEENFRSLLPEFKDATWCLHGSGGVFNGFGRLRTEWFLDPVRIAFGDIELCAPSDPIGFFEQRYGGGWREFPSDRKYRTYSAADLNIPGDVVSRDYMQFIDQDQAISDFAEYTNLLMDESCLLHDASVPRLKTYAELQAQRVTEALGNSATVARFSSPAAQNATPDEAVDALSELKKAINLIRDEELNVWHIAAPLGNDVLAAVLWAQFIAEPSFWIAQKMLGFYEEPWQKSAFPTSEAANRLRRAIEACSGLYRAIDFSDEALLKNVSETLNELCPRTVHAAIAQAYLLQGTQERCLGYIDSLPEGFKSNDYLLLLRARLLLNGGDSQNGEKALEELASRTENGMIVLAVNDLSAEYNLNVHIDVKPLKKQEGKTRKAKKKPNATKGLRKFGFAALSVSARHGFFSTYSKFRELERLRAQIEPYAEKIARYRSIRRVSSERFKTWETMFPRKQMLRKAVANGKLERITTVSRAYKEAIYRVYDRDGCGVFIDQEMLDAIKPVLVQERGQEFLDDFLAKIPDAHKRNLDELLREEGVNHPYFRSDWSPTGNRK